MTPILESNRCMSWASLPFSKNKQFCGRLFSYGRMIPGFAALIVSITGVVLAVIWSCPYLSIPFGLGTLPSVYLIYLGYEQQNLKDFSENNQQLETCISSLGRENEALRQEISTFGDENQKLKETSLEMEELVSDFRDEKDLLAEENQRLQKSVADLEKVQELLNTTVVENIADLGKLSEGLANLQYSVEEDHVTFGRNLTKFQLEMDSLKITRTDLIETQSKIDNKIEEQVEALSDVTNRLNTIFSKINEWKNEKYVKAQIESLVLLQKQISNLEANIESNKKILGIQDKQLKIQATQIKEFAELEKKFKNSLDTLVEQTSDLRIIGGDLHIEIANIKETAQIFQKYDSKIHY